MISTPSTTTSKPLVGEVYQHYKGNKYRIIGLGHHSEDTQPYVIYQGLYTCSTFGPYPLWVRPLSLFTDTIVDNQGVTCARFTLIIDHHEL